MCGTEVLVQGGQLRDVRDCGCPPGTNVRVRNLFFNLPARRKFLRQAATEDVHIQETVLMQALAHPGVAFELSVNDQTVLQAAASADPGARVAMLLGRDVYDAMMPVDYAESGIAVTGFVTRPGVTRTRRRDQRTFVNGRPAEAEAIYQGIREAYHTLVMPGRYPPAVLYVTLPPETVDVNVHPTKREVRFRDGNLVSQIVAAAVRRSLRSLAAPAPGRGPSAAGPAVLPAPPMITPELRTPQPAVPDPTPAPPLPPVSDPTLAAAPRLASQPAAPLAPSTSAGPGGPGGERAAPPPVTVADRLSVGVPRPVASRPAELPSPDTAAPGGGIRAAIKSLRVIGMLQSRYLVAQGQSGLVLVDQRAAHERILFERLLAAARSRQGVSQPLLIPVTAEVPPADAELLRRHGEEFARLGFEIEPFGGGTFVVTAIPAHFPQENVAGILRDILDDLREGMAGAIARPDEVALAQAASRHALSPNVTLTPEEVEQLLDDLAHCELPYTCPQGRPVMVNIPYSEIEKRFGRRGN